MNVLAALADQFSKTGTVLDGVVPIVQELKKSQSNAENFYDPVLDAGGYNGGRCRIENGPKPISRH